MCACMCALNYVKVVWLLLFTLNLMELNDQKAIKAHLWDSKFAEELPKPDHVNSDVASAFTDLHYHGISRKQEKTGYGDQLVERYPFGCVLRGIILLCLLPMFHFCLLPGQVSQTSLLLCGLLLRRN